MKHANEYLARATGNAEVTQWINSNLANYTRRSGREDQGEIEHILDYLMSDEAPSRLRSMSYDAAKANAEKWTKMLMKRGDSIAETEEDVDVVLQSDAFRWVRLKSKRSFEREGNLMRHCVASYYGKSDVEIYSLRDVRNQPHCTIEIRRSGNDINQVKGRGNGPIHPRYISTVLEFLQERGMQVRQTEMQYLGYIPLPDSLWEDLDSKYRKLKQVTLQGTRYLFLHQDEPN